MTYVSAISLFSLTDNILQSSIHNIRHGYCCVELKKNKESAYMTLGTWRRARLFQTFGAHSARQSCITFWFVRDYPDVYKRQVHIRPYGCWRPLCGESTVLYTNRIFLDFKKEGDRWSREQPMSVLDSISRTSDWLKSIAAKILFARGLNSSFMRCPKRSRIKR